jgi:hypothetical protein
MKTIQRFRRLAMRVFAYRPMRWVESIATDFSAWNPEN